MAYAVLQAELVHSMGLVDTMESSRSAVSQPPDNAGEDAVVAALLGRSGGASEASVYGCALRRTDDAPGDEG